VIDPDRDQKSTQPTLSTFGSQTALATVTGCRQRRSSLRPVGSGSAGSVIGSRSGFADLTTDGGLLHLVTTCLASESALSYCLKMSTLAVFYFAG